MVESADRFDENLRKLLTHAYEVPEYRAEFKAELLTRLRDSQRLKAARRRTPTPRVFVLGALSGMAAAALVMLLLVPHFYTDMPVPTTPRGPDSLARFEPESATAPSVEPDLVAAAASPAETPSKRADPLPLPITPEPDRSAPPREGLVWDSQPAEIDQDLLRGRSLLVSKREAKTDDDALEFRHASTAGWHPVTPDGTFVLNAGTQFRSLRNAIAPVGVWVDDQTKLVMNPGGMVTNEGEGLRLEKGSVLLSVAAGHKQVCMMLPEHAVDVEPGSEVYFKVRNDEEYAPSGAPVPTVIVLKGRAAVHPKDGDANQLLAGKVYELYDTPTGAIPSRDLCDLMREQVRPTPALRPRYLPEVRARRRVAAPTQALPVSEHESKDATETR